MSEQHVTSPATDGHGHGHGTTHQAPFGPAEMAEFQKSDIGAGGAVVVLMSAIFGVGLVLYTAIAILVAM